MKKIQIINKATVIIDIKIIYLSNKPYKKDDHKKQNSYCHEDNSRSKSHKWAVTNEVGL